MGAIVSVRDTAWKPRITASRAIPGVRAGSGLLRIGRRLLAIQDDAYAAIWIDPIARQIELLKLRGGGDALPKSEKPDFESAFMHEGRAWILGSGSRPNRSTMARVDLATREAVLLNALPLFGAVTRAVGRTANVEGAVPDGARLRLFNRGVGMGTAAGGNFILDFPIGVLAGEAPGLLQSQAVDLGEVEGVKLTFTDAVALAPGRALYLAVAERTADAIADGEIAGCAVGIVEAAGARWAPLLEAYGQPCKRKVEGVALDEGGKAGWLLTDPDDAGKPAELCRFEFVRG
ncbi:MAG TPA: hypothetical protein VM240_07925 [Verrucomicrobiae bacterium]|nr:hypothetical protein [Verrucomicrobiae bacterium]